MVKNKMYPPYLPDTVESAIFPYFIRDGSRSQLVSFFGSGFDPSRSRSQLRILVMISEESIQDPIRHSTEMRS